MASSALLRRVLRELPRCAVDLDRIGHRHWWHPPFDEAELNVHPDGERIRSTIEVAARELLLQAIVAAGEPDE